MARTIQQIGADITANAKLDIMEYVKDYASKIINANTDKLNAILQDVYSHVNGIDIVVGHLGKPLDPAASDPASPNEYDWYFNTTSKEFKMYHNSSWTVIATLSATVDLTGYYTKTETDARFEPKSFNFSASDLTWTESTQDIYSYIILDKPADAANTLVGGYNKIKIKKPADASSPVHADAQVTYGADLMWINKASNDIMTFNEIASQVSADKVMVIKKISDGNWELVRWEVGGTSTATGVRRAGILPEHPQDIPWLLEKYENVSDFFNKAANYEIVKYNSLPNGDPINIIIYVKTPTGIKEFRCWEEVNTLVNVETNRLQKQIDINFQDITENSKDIKSIKQMIADLNKKLMAMNE